MFGGVVAANLIAGEDPLRGNRRFNVFDNATNDTRPNRDVDLSYCSVKTGVNDLLDYMAISVSLIIPFVIGPLVVGVFQVREMYQQTIFSLFMFIVHQNINSLLIKMNKNEGRNKNI